jgi:WD40 repeat protein
VALNESGTHALIGGKGIFKTVKVEGGHCTEDLNLRTTILSTPKNASGAPRDIYQIDVADVAWAKRDFSNYIVAATSSGKIILYNLGIAGLQGTLLHEHSRQVHKVHFNPHFGNLLLSGSQDGTVRLWDLRAYRTPASTLHSKRKFSGQAGGVRDVKWSPTDGFDFAFGTDNGDIQRWDWRYPNVPKVKVSGHLLACNAVDWHPDGKHIVSAGSDKMIRVFDVSVNRPKKATWEIKTPYPVMNARWRPSCESSIKSDNGANLCVQVLACYSSEVNILHLWDFRRPRLPFREFAPYASAPTGLNWHSQDLLWTVGREGLFMQTDLHYVPKAIETRNLQALAISPRNEIFLVAQARKAKSASSVQRPVIDLGHSHAQSPSSELWSRSWADDSLDQTFLSVAPPHRQHVRTDSRSRNQDIASGSVTPHSDRTAKPTIKLDDILFNRKSFRPRQASFRGNLPDPGLSFSAPEIVLHHLVSTFETMSINEVRTHTIDAIDLCTQSAATAGAVRLYQSWKIVEFCLLNHLRDKEALCRELDKGADISHSRNDKRIDVADLATRFAIQYMKSPSQSPLSMQPVSSVIHHLAMPESTSNVPTPLVRPTTTSRLANLLPLPDTNDEHLVLPPSLVQEQSALAASLRQAKGDHASTPEQRLTAHNLTDLETQQIKEEADEHLDRVERWSAQRRLPHRPENPDLRGSPIMPMLEKHDSQESFKFLEGSFESGGAYFPGSLSSYESSNKLVAERPSRKLARKEADDDAAETSIPVHESMLFEGSGTLADSRNVDQQPFGNSFSSAPEITTTWSPERSLSADSPVEQEGSDTSPDKPVIEDRWPIASNAVPIRLAEADHRPATQLTSAAAEAESVPNPTSDHDTGSIHAVESDHKSENAAHAADYIDLEDGKPWTLVEMLLQLLTFYTTTQPHPQAVSTLLLILNPHLPLTHPLPSSTIKRTIKTYLHHAIDHLNLDLPDVPHWAAQCAYSRPLQAGLQPLQIEAILSTYHEQLLSQQNFSSAAQLRKLSYPAYPAVYEDFLRGSDVHFRCGSCGKAVVPPSDFRGGAGRTFCGRCRRAEEEALRGCMICWEGESPWSISSISSTSTFTAAAAAAGEEGGGGGHSAQGRCGSRTLARLRTACTACGHAGHAACYQYWFGELGGVGCPTEGCLCSCMVATTTAAGAAGVARV